MKIALLTEYYKPEIGASQNRLFEMIYGLKQLGNEVYVVTGMPNYPKGQIFDGYKGKSSMEEMIDGIEVKRYWLYASNSKKPLPRVLNMFSFAFSALRSKNYLKKKKIDILIAEEMPSVLGFTARYLSRKTGAKLVANIPDLWPVTPVEMGVMREGSMAYKFLAWVEKYNYKHAVLCLGQSQEIVDYMGSHGAKSTYLFRNGVDPSRFDNLVRTRSDSTIRITYAGLLGFAQGIYGVCQNINFKELGVEFHIYGAGGEQAQIENYLRENPDCGIFFHGSVAREEVPQILVDSDATLVPLVKQIYGAVPSKIYESMAAGLPIIFSGEGEGARIVKENDLGWIAPARDYEKMEEIIREMKSSPEIISQKRRSCIDCAHNRFNRPKQIVALNEFLHQMFELEK